MQFVWEREPSEVYSCNIDENWFEKEKKYKKKKHIVHMNINETCAVIVLSSAFVCDFNREKKNKIVRIDCVVDK